MSGAQAQSKAIDPKLREAALEAARRHGLDLGAWATREIADDGDAPGASDADGLGARETSRVLEALERLTRRVEGADATAAGLDRSILTLSQRVEETEHGAREATFRAVAALGEVKGAQSSLAERLARVEQEAGGGRVNLALKALDSKLTRLATQVYESDARASADLTALRADMDAAAQASRRAAGDAEARIGAVDAQINRALSDLESSVRRISDRVSETEKTASTAAASLQSAIAAVDQKLAEIAADTRLEQETEALRVSLDERVNAINADVERTISDARLEFTQQLGSAIAALRTDEVEASVADVNRRVAAAERRHAQTIEAVSVEIKRLSEAMDRRLRAMEERNDGETAFADLRDVVTSGLRGLEARLDDQERREIETVSRLGLIGQRVDAADHDVAGAIEKISAHVRQIADLLSERQDQMARTLTERIAEGEERASARLSDAIGSVGARIAEIDERGKPLAEGLDKLKERLAELEARNILAPSAPSKPASPPQSRDASEPLAAPLFPMPEPKRAPPIAQMPPPPAFETPDPFGLDDEPTFADAEPPPFEATPFDAVPLAANAAPANDDDGFWSLDDAEPLDLGADAVTEEFDALSPAPIANDHAHGSRSLKDDYLAQARRAAQLAAQSPQKSGKAKAKTERAARPLGPEPSVRRPIEPASSLRGSTRVAILGAGAAVIAAAAAGAWWLTGRPAEETPDWAKPAHAGQKPVADVSGAPLPEGPPGSIADGAAKAAALDPNESALLPANLEAAAEAGDSVALFARALQRMETGQGEAGLADLRKAANQGLAIAQYRLAKSYERGQGVGKDIAQARQWTEKAAAAGNVKAMHDLGVYFASGEGAPFDEAAAFRWFRQAAEFGVKDSQFNLGVLYQQGRGAAANPDEAAFWFFVAAAAGDAAAAKRAEMITATMKPQEVAAIRARAQNFKPKAPNPRANGDFRMPGQVAAAASPTKIN
jgi:localization factor PodJL